MKISWAEYKAIATSDLELDGAVIYRGQRLASWGLVSSVHRTALVRSIPDLKGYADYMLPRVHDALEAWVGRSWDLKHSLGLAEFLAFAQHNGFPTPLLDWTASPYIAAYFAFEGVNHFKPQSERVAIFAFNQEVKSTISPTSRRTSQYCGRARWAITSSLFNKVALR
ncbi:FRG domain-containing protein [Methylomicrobium agile]|uniref:FRG domain-containing protein n=1 Tax=Methylomicrobium agile TaxID=39774 RepID=UPI001C035045|nr:FRG domain-containing protein [Methylomicrobium agile]